MLVAVPIMKEVATEGAVGDLEVLVLDTNSLQIRHRLRLKDWLQSDAIYISDMSFDTARYQLAPDQMAFGLRIVKNGSSQVYPFEETRLSLFIIDGQDLRVVLRDALVEHHLGDWDTNCRGEYSDTTSSLAMSADSHNGFSDIIISGKETVRETFEGPEGTCDERILVENKSTATLEYDGSFYPYPTGSPDW